MEEIGGEKPPDEKMSNFDTKKWPDTEDPTIKGIWPGTEEVPVRPSWAQILGGQVADDEVKKFEKEFKLMVPGEGAVAKINGSDYVMRKKYLKDLTEIVKENDEGKAKMKVLHFKIEEIDEEGNKINYTEGESNEMLAKKDEAAVRLSVSLFNSKWLHPCKGLDTLLLGDSFYLELEEGIKICEILKTRIDDTEVNSQITGNVEGKFWKLSLEDTRTLRRVTIKDALNKVDIEKLNSWMENFGEVTSIKPKIRRCPLEEKFKEDIGIPQEEREDLIRMCRNRASRGPDVEVIMDLKVSVPMILPINNWNIEIQHEDQVPQCQNCYLIGHYTSRCVNQKTQLKTYSSFANAKWGSVDDMLRANDQRKIDTIRHKLTVTRLLNRGVRPENIKSNKSIDNSMSKAIISKVRDDIEQRYKSRTKFHAKSDVFDRIKDKLNELKETDRVNLMEKGKMLKTLLVNRRMKIGEMRSLRLPVNLNELSEKYEKSLMYITVLGHNDLQGKRKRHSNGYGDGQNTHKMTQKQILDFFSPSNFPPNKREREGEPPVVNKNKRKKTAALQRDSSKRKNNVDANIVQKKTKLNDTRAEMEKIIEGRNEMFNTKNELRIPRDTKQNGITLETINVNSLVDLGRISRMKTLLKQ